jgi:hypothetical protein
VTKPIDKDILAIKQAAKALRQSSSPHMLRANLQFLIGHCLSEKFIASLRSNLDAKAGE